MTSSTQSNKGKSGSKSSDARRTKSTRLPGAFVWYDVRSPDVEASAAFFRDLVGWTIEAMPMGGATFTVASTAAGPCAAFEKSTRAELVSYVSVDDVDAAAERVQKAGGKVVGAPVDVPGIGRMLEVADPDGAAFFLFTGAGDDRVVTGPGAFVWNELWATSTKRALAFYTSLLGYEVDEMSMGGAEPYRVLKTKRASEAGLMASPVPGMPAHWLPYIHVTDVDAAVAHARRLGGNVDSEPQDIPGVGRYATLRSPQGARFALLTPAAA